MQFIHLEDIDSLAQGATLLGSGGGGDQNYAIPLAKHQIMQYGPAHLIQLEELMDEDLILPLGFVGAPLVAKEKLPGGAELPAIIEAFRRYYGKLPSAILPAEIGGANALTPLFLASQFGLKIIDGDLLGRAFPELQMASANLYGINPSPTFTSDSIGNTTIIEAKTANDIERLARSVSVACGSSMAVGTYVMTVKQAKEALIQGTISYALELGKILTAHGSSLTVLLQKVAGTLVTTGTIIDLEQKIENGFLNGTVFIKSGNTIYKVVYQNEYLAIYQDNKLTCVTPDIIAILDETTLSPITTENLSFGLRVSLIFFAGPKLWYSKEGLALVGKEAFKLLEVVK